VAELTPEAIGHIARIARLALTREEKERFAAEAAQILGHFEAVMRSAPASPAEAPAPPLTPRPDAVTNPEGAQVDAIVGQFPRRDGKVCKVPGGL
jgi:Asp-tRNA(Asn)/Glu-tRNA(Gln) amidotransferase C subunit